MSQVSHSIEVAEAWKQMPQAELGQIIKTHRLALGLSQGDIGTPAGVSPAYVSRIEAGARRPSLKVLQIFADTMNIPIETLVLVSSSADGQLYEIREVTETVRTWRVRASSVVTAMDAEPETPPVTREAVVEKSTTRIDL